MKRIKHAVDPARPDFRHYFENGKERIRPSARVEAMIHEYGGKLGSHLPNAFLRIPGSINNGAACFPWPIVRMLYSALDPAIWKAEGEATGGKLFVGTRRQPTPATPFLRAIFGVQSRCASRFA